MLPLCLFDCLPNVCCVSFIFKIVTLIFDFVSLIFQIISLHVYEAQLLTSCLSTKGFVSLSLLKPLLQQASDQEDIFFTRSNWSRLTSATSAFFFFPRSFLQNRNLSQ